MTINKYRVYITPLERETAYKDTAFDATEYIKEAGIGDISQRTDSTDFDIGIYTYDYVDITFFNFTRYFSDIEMGGTKFKFGRDRAKVLIQYLDLDGNYEDVFKGIINDEFTTQNFNDNTVKFRVMSYDSVFRKLVSQVGTIASGQTVKVALQNLFNRPEVTSLMGYDADNINPVLDLVIDEATPLYNISFKDALDLLLRLSCSVMYLDEDNNIIVRSREQNPDLMREFWNWGDLLGRNNIVGIEAYNTGLQRAFNLFNIGSDISSISEASVAVYGLRNKDLNDIDDIITDTEKQQSIVDAYRDSFAIPKKELKLTVKSELAKDLKLFDLITIGYTSRPRKRPDALFIYVNEMPIDGEVNMPYITEGQEISSIIGFKIIEKTIKADRLLTTLKLREIGITTGDNTIDFIQDDPWARFIYDSDNNRIQDG